ncbi:MAG: DUF2341 domain-containing protein, partial [Planctomycetota bacterium]
MTVDVNAVQDAPTVTNLVGDTLAYKEGDGAQVIEQGDNALVADADSTDFDGGNLTVSVAQPDWWDGDWGSRTKITFDNSASSGDLSEFPVLVSLTASDIDFDKILTDGEDIRFVDGDGTELNYEIETWDDTAKTATIWVKVPVLSATNSDFIHLYYNNTAATDGQNATGVWDTTHEAVWHLEEQVTDEQTSGVHYDSTGVHNGSQVNNDDYSGQGRLAQTFDGTGDYIAVADHDDLTFANAGVDSAFSVSAWIRGDTGSAMIVDKYTSSDGWEFYIDGGRLTFDLNTATGWIGERTTAVVSGAWQHVAATYDGSKATTGIKLYIDGVLQATTTIGDAVYDGMSNSTTEVEIGAYDGGGNSWDFNGQIDEVRLGSTERSADWINASYLSQNGTFAFNSFGTEESAQLAEDVLSIRDEGTGTGEIGFSGGNVTYEGVLIGTATGGSGSDLVVTFNANATPTAVSALVNNVTFEDTETVTITEGNRTVSFTINDGDGATSIDYDTTVTVSPNTAPTAADNTVTTNEDTGYTFAAGDFGFSDGDAGDSLTKIQITSLESAGTLKLSGVDVTLNQEILLADIGNLVFTPVADANGTGYDSFQFKVHDGTEYSAAANTITVDVTAVQDAPTAADNTITINEDTGYTFSAADFGFSDVDAGDSLTKIQITVLESAGTLKLSGADVTLNQEILVADIPNLVFTPAQDANGTGYDEFQFKVHDGTEYSATQVLSTLVNATFDADVEGFTYADDTFGTSNPTSASGSWNATAGNGGGGALEVHLGDTQTGTNSSGAYSKTINLAADSWVRITFDYNLAVGSGYESGEYGEAIFAVDGTRYGSDTNNSLLHHDAGGGAWSSGYATATETIFLTSGNHTLDFGGYSSGNQWTDEWTDVHFDNILVEEVTDYVMTIDVTAVQDAPTAADKTITIDEDVNHTFAAADFGFSDVDAGDSLTKIQITSLETAGALKLSGVDVTLNQEILVADITGGNLVFEPASNQFGTGYDSFDFKVHDGTEYSVAANTITVDVTPVSDWAPTAADNTVTTDEDVAHVFTLADFNYSDADPDPFTQVQITSLESVGNLKLSGADVTLNQVISVADISAGNLTFTSALHGNGAGYDSFQFKVHDSFGYSAAAYTMTMDVTAVNDAPTGTSKTVTTVEDTAFTFAAADFGYSDVESDPFTKIQITSLESGGTLKLSGVDVTLNQEILVADIPNLVYLPAQDGEGAAYDSFQFKVHDGTEYSVAANTITVDVTAVQDAPTGTDNTVTTLEETPYTFAAGDFGFTDPDAGDSLTKIQITSLESNGDLKLSGVDVTLNQEIL